MIVSASGQLDLRLRVFKSGEAPTLIVTTTAGAKRLRKQTAPDSVEIRSVRSSGAIRAQSILNKVGQVRPSTLILVEGGPRLLGDFYAQHVLDEQFLTLAPQIAGRDDASERPKFGHGADVRATQPVVGHSGRPQAWWQSFISALLIPVSQQLALGRISIARVR